MNVDKFRKDHEEILAQVNELRELVNAGITENAAAIANLVITMSTVVKLHLAAEDRVLYPAYSKSNDSSISKIGQMFQKEMGGIASVYLEFVRRWSIPSKVSADPMRFREEANSVFKALHQRIQRENKELYPLSDHV
jgi:hemerythrin-like domain-containing protein